jgi:hypothetical protein
MRLSAQTDSSGVKLANNKKDGNITPVDSSKQRDVIDLLYKLVNKTATYDHRKQPKKIIFSVVPSIGYTLTTGFGVDLTGNAAFYTSTNHQENLSNVLSDLAFDTKNQKILISRSEIWGPDNSYKFVSDIRLEAFPTETYGLGTFTTEAKTDEIDYDYIRIYGTLYKTLLKDFYGGMGYNLDYHYNITEQGNLDKTESDFKKYGEPSQSTSSGLNFSLLFDNRQNSINPLGGTYADLIYRQNFTFLGSDADWHSTEVDLREYLKPSTASNNVLAFWALGWFASTGTPYLDLPAIGQDMYNNSGRGYAEGRFRGTGMLYLEGEYRFGVSRNGLFGGVVFLNGESFTEYPDNDFKRVAPGTGAGIRIKANKHSNTNICIDYGVGLYGSHGFFVNLGEVF